MWARANIRDRETGKSAVGTWHATGGAPYAIALCGAKMVLSNGDSLETRAEPRADEKVCKKCAKTTNLVY